MSVLDTVRERSLFDPQNKRLAMYIAVGLVGAAINQTIYVVSLEIGLSLLLASVLSRVLSTLSNYVMNDTVTWRGRGAAGFGQWCWRGVKYVLTRVVGIGIGTAAVLVFVNVFGIPKFWANPLSMGVGLAWGFGASEKWVWSEDSSLSLDSVKQYVGEDKRE